MRQTTPEGALKRITVPLRLTLLGLWAEALTRALWPLWSVLWMWGNAIGGVVGSGEASMAIGAGDRPAGGVYADIDMTFGDEGYFHKDGTPYPTERIK